MASLAEKTKDTNTFRFKSFGDRVNEIDLRHLALYHIGHRNEELDEEENTTYFQQTIQKWNVLNLTEEYNYFSKRCRKIVTLPQLLHQQDFVVDLLLERLSTATYLSQQPLLELLYVLARDLREEFYPYFQRVLDRLICLLNTQDSEQLEWTLICLAHLFKTLKPYLKRNIGVVFNAILPLLDEQHYAEHVTNFAVECFAYIARDVRDFPRFLTYVLKTVLREQVESVHGCGRLIYEILRGVNGQLHNSAAEIFSLVLEVLVNKDSAHTKDQTELLGDIVEYSLGLLLNFLRSDQSNILWQKLCSAASSENVDEQRVIGLMLPLVTHKNGRYVSELPLVVGTLLKLLGRELDPLQPLTTLVTSLLKAQHTQLTQLDASRLLQKLLSISRKEVTVYEDAILQLLDYSQFEILVLPNVIGYFEEQRQLSALELLARIVQHKRPLQVDGNSLAQWVAYPLQLKQNNTIKFVEQELLHLDLTKEEHLLLIILVPHLRGFNKQDVEQGLQSVIEKLISDNENDFTQLLLLLQTHALLKFNLPKSLLSALNGYLIPELGKDIRALACLQVVLLQGPKNKLPTSDELLFAIGGLLSQPVSLYRRIAAHCLDVLNSSSKPNPYSHFYAAACIEPTVHNYRELLLQLQQLEPASAQFKQFSQLPHFKEHAVSLLLGLLYNNFKFVWAPVQQLLAAYVKTMTVDEFWTLFKAKLVDTVACIDYKKEVTTLQVPYQMDYQSAALTMLLPLPGEQQLSLQQALNYRQLLWQTVPKLGTLSEVKNADLVRLCLQFVDNEYRAQLEKSEHTWNVNEATAADIDVEEDDENENNETKPEPRGRQKRRTQNAHTKFILQTLQLKLACFVSQPNPKALHRQAEMHDFYLELLAGPNSQLQQLALDCLAAYKQPAALVQQKAQLSGLIDEEKFKTTLSGFELSSITAQQRSELIPFMLRVLYGKMLTKGVQKQLSAQLRKTLILRFLGQLEESEIMDFLQMAFGRFSAYTDKPVNEVATYVRESYDPSAVIAAKQLQRSSIY
ncbi:GM15917 [Drosophila sechellia]|uniref:GM15917 n=1 Tax=Drosophila sechellia TaxID=7238 RepID=B4I854_DROSE|nr:GM15917 [Drosophila sechellia]